MSYEQAKEYLITSLLRDAEAHEQGRYNAIDQGFEEFDHGLPRDRDRKFDKLFIAFNFWDGWIDARNHDWRYYKPIMQSDWPRLARLIIEDIRADREIIDPIIVDRFDLKKRAQRGWFLNLFKNCLGMRKNRDKTNSEEK